MARMTGNRYFAEAMQAYGVSHLFFVPTMMLPAMAEMENMGITRVVTHGEKAAAYMADGYARASRRPGICLAQNIGSTNMAAGLSEEDLSHAHTLEQAQRMNEVATRLLAAVIEEIAP